MRTSSNQEYSFEEAVINLTPLIDVVFVVLIIFIIIVPMLELDRVELASAAPISSKEAVATPETAAITIHVHKDNTIWVGGKELNEQQLIIYLKEAKKKGGLYVPQLFQDKRAAFGTYQTVKNAVEIAGFEELDVILKPG